MANSDQLVYRVDSGKIVDFRETREGFLDLYFRFSKCDKAGDPLVYSDGQKTWEEWLPEEELFNEESLQTATGKPIVGWEHPRSKIVDSSTAKELSIGLSGQLVRYESPFASIVGTVYDKQTVDDIKSGKLSDISAGYSAFNKQDSSGRIIQVGRRYNHFALLPPGEGRAGTDVGLLYADSLKNEQDLAVQICDSSQYWDNARKSQTPIIWTNVKIDKGAKPVSHITLKVDSNKSITVEQTDDNKELITSFQNVVDSRDTLSSENASLTAENETLKADAAKMKAEKDVYMAEKKKKEEEDKNRKADASDFKAGYNRALLEQDVSEIMGEGFEIKADAKDADLKREAIFKLQGVKSDSAEAAPINAYSDLEVSAYYNVIKDLKVDSMTSLQSRQQDLSSQNLTTQQQQHQAKQPDPTRSPWYTAPTATFN